MHVDEMVDRTIKAQDNLLKAARRVTAALDIHPDHIAALMPQSGNNQVRQLLTIEACARLLRTIADAVAGPGELASNAKDGVAEGNHLRRKASK